MLLTTYVLPLALGCLCLSAGPALHVTSPGGGSSVQGQLPAFEENLGQWPVSARYVAGDGGMLVRLDERKLGLQVFAREGQPNSGVLIELGFAHTCADVSVAGDGLRPELRHYFIGDESARWRSGARSFDQVHARGLWNGIDLILHHSDQGFEYDFVL